MKDTMSQWKLKALIKTGEDFKCPFHLPPFNGDVNEGSFDIHEFKETKNFKPFIAIINSLEIKYEYAKYKKRIFLVVNVNNE